jgi:H+-transporting ATPase
MVAIIFMVSFYRHESFLDTLQFALVLTIAAIPVALPAVLSVTMAVGASVLAKKKAIVSKLVAIEEMAGMDILCSDKTGTITKNELTLAEVKAFEGFTTDDVLVFASLASREEDKDPIDTAIIEKAKSIKTVSEKLNLYQVKDFKPFDPVIKRSEVTITDKDNKSFKITKGAPQVISELMEAADKEKATNIINKQIDEFAAKGFRTLGTAKTDEQGKWQYVGLIPLFDPPRDDSAATIKTAQEMGVDVKMITGDHTAIAKQIAQKVNLKNNILEAATFLDKPDKEAGEIVEKAD